MNQQRHIPQRRALRRVRFGANAGKPVKTIDQLIDHLQKLKNVAIKLKHHGQDAFEAHALVGDDLFIKINASKETAELVASGAARCVTSKGGVVRAYYDLDGVMVTWIVSANAAQQEAA